MVGKGYSERKHTRFIVIRERCMHSVIFYKEVS